MRKFIIFLFVSLIVLEGTLGAREISGTDFVRNINILFLREDYRQLIDEADKGLRRYRLSRKEKNEILYLEGLSCIKTGNCKRARDIFNEILQTGRDGYREKAYIGIADSYFYAKESDKARQAYEEILKRFPESDRLNYIYKNLEAASGGRLTREGPTYYIVQLGAFRSLRNAKKLTGRLARKKFEYYIQKTAKNGRTLYRVRAGKFSNKSYAMRLYGKLKKKGFPAKVIIE